MIVEREIQHGEYLYSVTFSTGVDAFFYSEEAASLLGNSVEIVEVSLDRLQGEGVDQPDIIYRVTDVIMDYMLDNPRAILCYWCDDMNPVPCAEHNLNMLPQQYRNRLFTALFVRTMSRNQCAIFQDKSLCINPDCHPMYIHVIHRLEHTDIADGVMRFVSQSYGK